MKKSHAWTTHTSYANDYDNNESSFTCSITNIKFISKILYRDFDMKYCATWAFTIFVVVDDGGGSAGGGGSTLSMLQHTAIGYRMYRGDDMLNVKT